METQNEVMREQNGLMPELDEVIGEQNDLMQKQNEFIRELDEVRLGRDEVM